MTLKATLSAAFPEARRISNFLERDFGGAGVVVSLDERADGVWSVDAYFEEGGAEQIESELRDWLGADAFGAPLKVETVPALDWIGESLKSLTPVSARRFLVHGSHHRGQLPLGRTLIEIEAGQAFGTGHHASTAGVLSVIDHLIAMRRFPRILDLGTGSGVLAIALAKATRKPVLATDIDPIAVRVASENAVLNKVGGLVTTIEAAGVSHASIQRAAPFDLVVANILAEPLCRLAPRLAPLIGVRGVVVLSGILVHQRERVVAAYGAQGIRLKSARFFDGWAVLTLEKP